MAFFNSGGKMLTTPQERDRFYELQKKGVVYWLQNPEDGKTLGPFFGSFPRDQEYLEGWYVYGFTPDIVGTVILENTDGK